MPYTAMVLLILAILTALFGFSESATGTGAIDPVSARLLAALFGFSAAVVALLAFLGWAGDEESDGT